MYSDIFCKVYNEFGWNYYPEIFGEQLLIWLKRNGISPKKSMDLACGTGVLCRILRDAGITASGMDFSSGMIGIAREADPEGHYDVADMTTYCPETRYDLVTCTGDAVNHIMDIRDVAKIFRNVYAYTAPGGYFIFDLLNEREVSASDPFESPFEDNLRVWFQMTRPAENRVTLTIRVYEGDLLRLEEHIRETIHDPATVCNLLKEAGFSSVRCSDRLLEDANPGTTWFIVARK